MTPNKLFERLKDVNEQDIRIGSSKVIQLFTEAIRIFDHPSLITSADYDFDVVQISEIEKLKRIYKKLDREATLAYS